jgi:CheY-like chemotaxis protein
VVRRAVPARRNRTLNDTAGKPLLFPNLFRAILPPQSAPRMSSKLDQSQPTLLVFHVNDSTDDQVLFQLAAKQAGVPFSWRVADSAQTAIDYFESLLKLSESQNVVWPDLVVLDIVMPGESGFKVLHYIRSKSNLRRLPVVVFTGRESKEVMEEAYSLGANSFMLKPPDLAATVQLVSALYNAWSTARRPTV